MIKTKIKINMTMMMRDDELLQETDQKIPLFLL